MRQIIIKLRCATGDGACKLICTDCKGYDQKSLDQHYLSLKFKFLYNYNNYNYLPISIIEYWISLIIDGYLYDYL